jgi:mannan endo-1,4-beta-mannosidase
VTQPTPEPSSPWSNHRRSARVAVLLRVMTYVAVVAGVVAVVVAALIIPKVLHASPAQQVPSKQSVRYLGVYEPDAPGSYTGINQFAQAIGRQPNVALYYSQWLQPFNTSFAVAAAKHGAETLVQIAPRNISLESIASGRYDAYLHSYASEVKAFRTQVILSFGHEMNGYWYSWGYTHTSPAVFVAAWQHIVTVFRSQGTTNVTWLWTVNIIGMPNRIPEPSSWWPGNSYVNWVGIDGYYWNSTTNFSSLFAPTIAGLRELTSDPILIAETGAEPSAGQSAKIADLFAGVATFGLLGFVYYDDNNFTADTPSETVNWRLSSPAALAAFRQDAKAFMEPPGKFNLIQSGH